MRLLTGAIRPYAWGSRTALAELRGEPTPSPHPEAELWFGAHPGDPATAAPENISLLTVIDADPDVQLGAVCVAEFGGRLPFLMKVLAAEEPLSLQAHPSSEQAREGFARENAAGIALNAPERNYRDDSHKPELVVALTEFEALAGFREPAETIELLRLLQVAELDPYLGMIAGEPDSQGLRALFTTWITLPEALLARLVPAVLDGAVAYLGRGETRFAAELKTVLQLGEAYPGDPGVLAALLLNRIHLNPGQGIFMSAGNLHAYLSGSAVEIMANSDNVLRGGLTPKHVDVAELLKVLDFHPVRPEDLAPRVSELGAEQIYETSVPEFRMSRIELDGTGMLRPESISFDMPGPQILVCVQGAIELRSTAETLTVRSGAAVWLADGDPDVVVRASSARAVFFRGIVPVPA
ncbi:mannose-6-phosphate isomerase, class I [Jongsikchunia kroppenstedtii]|uniref:mannose-6-phosphate isomerase, class I n=1 Tax=Jongsikchunia kroppenstedtii TaxID=1121721 RepID=UPI00038259A2|nr:mannose-6-phosphate isomerase, class I [Jongsikchunia kroppenstedtii]